MKRRHFNHGLLAAMAGAYGTTYGAASAQEAYPNRLITFVVAYSAGGSADQRARQIARFMANELGQAVVIDNRPGAAANIGTEYIARARPDGYTIGMGNLAPLAVNPSLFKKLGFDPEADLTKIALIEQGPLLLVVHPESPLNSLADLTAAARKNRAGLSYGSSGVGSAHHLCGELLKAASKGEFVHVPYKSGSAAMTDLYGRQLDFMFEPMYSALPAARAGKIRALAITSQARSPLLPALPTMAEAGIPGFHMENWQGLVGPANLPAALVKRLNDAVNKALADPAIREQMLAQGNEPAGGTPAQFAEFVRAERRRWAEVVRTNRIVPE